MTEPTFSGWRDRAMFAFAEHPFVILAGLMMLLASFVAFLLWGPSITVPPFILDFLVGSIVLLPMTAPSGWLIVRYVRRLSWIEVHLCDAEAHAKQDGKAQEKFMVPPEVWKDKNVGEYPPTPINGGAAWQVQSYEWDEDLRELYVNGTPVPEVNSDRMFSWRNYVKDLFDHLIETKLQLGRARDRTSLMAADIQEAELNTAAEARERGVMLDSEATKDAWEDATSDLDSAQPEEIQIDDYLDPSDHTEEPDDE
jgi:hypothetical protein